MADNVSNASVASDVIAADEVGGVKFQRVKLAVGTDGQYVGDVSKETPLPVVLENGSVVDISNLSLAANTLHTSAEVKLSGASFRSALVITATTTGVSKVGIEVSPDGISYEPYYQIKYGFYNGTSTINLPLLPVVSKSIRYTLLSTESITLELLRSVFASNAKAVRQAIYENISFSAVGDTTPSFKIEGLRYLSALVNAISGGIVSYRWELSTDNVDWFNGSALSNTAETGTTCSITSNYGYSYARLRVVDSTTTNNVNSITLQGIS